MVGTHTDITERRQTERALRESQANLARAQEIAHLGSWERDLNTGSLRWSEETFRIFGMDPQTFSPTYDAFLAAVHPEDREALRASQETAWEKGARLDIEHRILRPDGSHRWVHQRGEVERDKDGNPARVTGTTLDITERKVAELALKESEQRFELAVRGTTAGIWDWNLRTDEVYHSPRHQEMLGYRPGEFVTTAAHFLEQIHPADVERVKQAIEAHLSKERRPYQVEYRLRTKEGEYRWFNTTGQAEFNEAGDALRMVGTTTDITERKQLEEQFLRVQRMESLGTLAGGIAHDLNNLLAPIMMGVGLLKSNDLNPKSKQVLANIERSALRGAELVKQVLSFARGVEGARVAVPIDQVVREIETIVRNTFPKNIRLETQVDSRLGMVLGDPLQLNQVLLNLCVNARDAMPAGGTLTVKVSDAEVDQPFAAMSGDVAPGRYVLVDVTDTGEGIDAGTMKRLFDPFFTTKTVGKGSGLGLSTTLGIVRSHGGFVHVQSEPGRGASFRVYLPAQHEDGMTMPAPEEVAELPRGHGELILVVDDERSILEVVRDTLEACGYSVLTAEDGAQAVGVYALNRKKVAAVITDMMMPVMDGAALIGALHRLDPDLPIIAASGLLGNGNLPAGIAADIRLFLAKPYSAPSLLTALDEVMATKAKRRAD
jgi:PAS domain S-box-containing protein